MGSPEYDGKMPDHRGYKFVRQEDIIVYEDPMLGQHADIAEEHGMVNDLNEDGKPIVDDAGLMNEHPSGEMLTYGGSSTCDIKGSIIEARNETDRILSSKQNS